MNFNMYRVVKLFSAFCLILFSSCFLLFRSVDRTASELQEVYNFLQPYLIEEVHGS